MFEASVKIEVGDGNVALFWNDNWQQGESVKLFCTKSVGTR